MSDIPAVNMRQLGASIGKDGRSMRLEIEGEDGSETHFIMHAAEVPAMCASLLGGARDCLGQLPPEEQVKLLATGLQKNLLNPIHATMAKAVMGDSQGQLMLHLGTIALQFRLPTGELRALAREITEG